MATDWEPYKDHMLEIMDAEQGFANVAGQGQCIPRPDSRPTPNLKSAAKAKVTAFGFNVPHALGWCLFLSAYNHMTKLY